MKLLSKLSLIAAAAVISIVVFSFAACEKKNTPQDVAISLTDTLLNFVKVTEIKTKLDEYWRLPYIKEYYGKRIDPPQIDFSVNLQAMDYRQLWFLKNELLARNGYLFDDPTLRHYFDGFKWYQPIYDVAGFVVELNSKEYDFLKKIIIEEKKRLGQMVVTSGQYNLLNSDMAVNANEFKMIPAGIADGLKKMNFIIIGADHDQLFHVYEQNNYTYIPSFITTDLYFQLVQKHIAATMTFMEKEKLGAWYHEMLNELYHNSRDLAQRTASGEVKEAAEWAAAYFAVPLTLLTGLPYDVPESVKPLYEQEVGKCMAAYGLNSQLLNSKLAEYSQFKPRGNYSGDKNMEQYFRCVKWLNSAKIVIDDPSMLAHPVALAYILNSSKKALPMMNKLSSVIGFLAGEENNISVEQISQVLQTSFAGKELGEIISAANLKRIYSHLAARDPRKFQIPAGTEFAKTELSKMSVVFSAARYTVDNEIYSRLVHILKPERRRILPKSLDVFAALGNSTADSLLHVVYKEHQKWPAYDDSLKLLKEKFNRKKSWDESIFSKTMQTMLSLSEKHDEYPLFMKTHFWEKKNLNTAQAAYTQLRHDFTLYIEELMAAECGDGSEGPPPPVHLSYVEPNMAFWVKSVELLNLLSNKLEMNGLKTDHFTKLNKDILDLGRFLLEMARKELDNKQISNPEFERLNGIGGWVEYLTINILGLDHIPDRDKEISQVINVFGFRDENNGTHIQNEALGKADEIYVLTTINGLPYITRGAVWSHYEFSSQESMTDEEWKGILNRWAAPQPEPWMSEIKIKSAPLETKPGNRY